MDPKLKAILDSLSTDHSQNSSAAKALDDEFARFLDETLNEVKGLFHKPESKAEQVESSTAKLESEDQENEDPNEESFPVLLPQTPRVRKGTKKRVVENSPPSPLESDRPKRMASKVSGIVIV